MIFLGGILSALALLTLLDKIIAKVLSDSEQYSFEGQDHRAVVKRGYSSENDFGPSIFVFSDILRLDSSAPSSSGSKSHYDRVTEHPWKGADLISGYELWLATGDSRNYQPMKNYADLSNYGHFVSGNVYSTDPQRSTFGHSDEARGMEKTTSGLSSLDGHLSGVLHTQISSSGGHYIYPKNTVSGNVDFSKDANLKSRHSSQSYGR